MHDLHIVNPNTWLCVSAPSWTTSNGPRASPPLGIRPGGASGTIRAVGGPDESEGGPAQPTWTFLTNHGHVLVCIASDPGIRGRDIAARVGITERAAQAIVADLVAEGYVVRTRVGRRNHYEINADRPLRHPVEQPHRIGELLELVSGLGQPRRARGVSRVGSPRPARTDPPGRPAPTSVERPGGRAVANPGGS